MDLLLDIVSWICLVAGGLLLIIGAVGMLRFPDFFTRLHAASIIETFGALLIITGLLCQVESALVSLKLIMIFILIAFTSPTAAHALAKTALHAKHKPMTGKYRS